MLACRNTGFCAKGDGCEYSHGIFEARLHPDSFRTVKCKDGTNCCRKICFFYHNEEERRTPTGLHEARAQITAELGDSAFDMTGDQLRSGAAPPCPIYYVPPLLSPQCTGNALSVLSVPREPCSMACA